MSESSYGDFRQRRQESVWHSLNRLLVTLIVIAVCILVVCAFLPLLKKQRELGARVADLKAEIEKKRLALNRATREEDLLRNDPGYVETVARDRLDLMKEGETIFRLEPPPIPDKSNFKLKR
jgi:cell division protein FtsB